MTARSHDCDTTPVPAHASNTPAGAPANYAGVTNRRGFLLSTIASVASASAVPAPALALANESLDAELIALAAPLDEIIREWNAIEASEGDELVEDYNARRGALADRIFSKPAHTVEGLAVQTRAITLDENQLWEPYDCEPVGGRVINDPRLLEYLKSACQVLGVVPAYEIIQGKTGPALAAPRSAHVQHEDDPIFAAIEAAREAEKALDAVERVDNADWAPVEAANALLNRARPALARTAATTPAGLVALTGFLREVQANLRDAEPYFCDAEDADAFTVSLDSAVQRMTVRHALASPDHSDPVIALADRVIETLSQARAACKAFGPFEEAMFAWGDKNPRPEALHEKFKFNPAVVFHPAGRRWLDLEMRQVCDSDIGDAESESEQREHEAAMKKWKRRERDAKRRCGYTKASKESEAADNAYFDTMAALIKAKSRTLEGLLAKVHVAQTTDPQDDLDRSIVEDLAQMFGVVEQEEAAA